MTFSYSLWEYPISPEYVERISDLIWISGTKIVMGNNIEIQVLLQKRYNLDIGYLYDALKIYRGSYEQKVRACLKQIRYNYDTYALGIISGEDWDNNARYNTFFTD